MPPATSFLAVSQTAAAAAKSLQSCPTLCDPIDGSPPGSSVHRIFQARVLEWGAIAFSEVRLGTLNKLFVIKILDNIFKKYFNAS